MNLFDFLCRGHFCLGTKCQGAVLEATMCAWYVRPISSTRKYMHVLKGSKRKLNSKNRRYKVTRVVGKLMIIRKQKESQAARAEAVGK